MAATAPSSRILTAPTVPVPLLLAVLWPSVAMVGAAGAADGGTPPGSGIPAAVAETRAGDATENVWQIELGGAQLETGLLTEPGRVSPGPVGSSFRSGVGLDDWLEPVRSPGTPSLRLGGSLGSHGLDLLWAPQSGLEPGRRSVGDWFPEDRPSDRVFGGTPALIGAGLEPGVGIDDDGPPRSGGFGSRYSFTGAGWDLGFAVQRNRPTAPYFAYRADTNRLEAHYPESWRYGGDVGFEALNATWRVAAAYLSDVPVTRVDGAFDTVHAMNYGAGVAFSPGRGDTRINMQLVGTDVLSATPTRDQIDSLKLQGFLETPLADDRWHFNIRLSAGVDRPDLYISPELTYSAGDPYEFYLQAHYFDGDPETFGGYYEDRSVIAIGWRSTF